jgi:tetratricopeptide (TPR) repeat protein
LKPGLQTQIQIPWLSVNLFDENKCNWYIKILYVCDRTIILGIFIPSSMTVNTSLSLSSDALAQNTSLADISVLNDKAKSLGNLGNYTEAIKYYDKALRIDPNNTSVTWQRLIPRHFRQSH